MSRYYAFTRTIDLFGGYEEPGHGFGRGREGTPLRFPHQSSNDPKARSNRNQAIKCYWEFAHTDSGCVPNCIRDRTGGASDSDFTHAFDAERIYVRVMFLDKDRFD